jgi:hypothetical protein
MELYKLWSFIKSFVFWCIHWKLTIPVLSACWAQPARDFNTVEIFIFSSSFGLWMQQAEKIFYYTSDSWLRRGEQKQETHQLQKLDPVLEEPPEGGLAIWAVCQQDATEHWDPLTSMGAVFAPKQTLDHMCLVHTLLVLSLVICNWSQWQGQQHISMRMGLGRSALRLIECHNIGCPIFAVTKEEHGLMFFCT